MMLIVKSQGYFDIKIQTALVYSSFPVSLIVGALGIIGVSKIGGITATATVALGLQEFHTDGMESPYTQDEKMLHIAQYILLCGAALTVIVSLFGIVGVAKSRPKFLHIYLALSALALVTSFAGMVITFRSGDVKRGIRTVVLILFQSYISYVIFRFRHELVRPTKCEDTGAEDDKFPSVGSRGPYHASV
ncbi:hypothetical protein K493DRAFT_360685 [Basidiobolus meristosporus CBS 931.73]|uniref:Uncharacterized protein n=1 Tax=Basidiobolus meristosporus CBS 931.73 TaxID=1314790 RepID=A0A1Y1XFI9_9FUNG|nr:hypothetical protein K493DRAFT_360685 [Basidiobolus meristosporus CBS 931.73]|eukprot:ORX84515.1 hypothetical protein K493DRAFT_360685 [Basidiobolus meristosporus CBS 931.73]